ncbi:helix-turn-helix domain-containing protein [Actinomadura rayongensis]|uniref:Helix-turn-helix domain-containing protein n=2 Tax=Actinomadura rayongensis TaxID=1429076 RepID=A0A6I4WLC9_9ACTN|nr:helix-turn-helix domain-containing protein [Actinomadura rayongensis]
MIFFSSHYPEGRRMPAPITGVKIRDPGSLKVLAKVRGISLRALAREVGCHPSLIDHLARGERRVSRELAFAIAEALGAGPYCLFEIPPEPCDRTAPTTAGRARVGRAISHRRIRRTRQWPVPSHRQIGTPTGEAK